MALGRVWIAFCEESGSFGEESELRGLCVATSDGNLVMPQTMSSGVVC